MQSSNAKQSTESSPRKGTDGPTLQKGLDAIASSLSLLGDTLGTAIEVILFLIILADSLISSDYCCAYLLHLPFSFYAHVLPKL